jgi:hypothetical protein
MTERFGGKEVVFAGDPAQAEMICDLLDAEGIDAEVRDAGVGGMVPYMTAAGGAGAVKVVVAPDDSARAREILENRAEFRAETTNPGDPDAPPELASPESHDESPLPARRRGRARTVAYIWFGFLLLPIVIISALFWLESIGIIE